MKYSNSLESYCKSPLCAYKINEIESKLATLASNHNKLLVWYVGAMAMLSAAFITFVVMEKGPSGIFVATPVILTVVMVWAIVWEYKFNPGKNMPVEIMGINYAKVEGFMDTVQTPALEQVSSPLGKQLIESIKKQDRQMRKFELTLIESLCKF